MARRWTQGGAEPTLAEALSVHSDTPSELRRLVGYSLLTMGAVLIVLGSQAPMMAIGFGAMFALFGLQAAIQVPAARRAIEHRRGGNR